MMPFSVDSGKYNYHNDDGFNHWNNCARSKLTPGQQPYADSVHLISHLNSFLIGIVAGKISEESVGRL
jgi:hypothetical protein